MAKKAVKKSTSVETRLRKRKISENGNANSKGSILKISSASKTIKKSSQIKAKDKLKPSAVIAKKTVPKKKPKREKIDEIGEEIKELENQYQVKIENVKQAIQGIISLTSSNPKLRNQLFNEQFNLFLQVNSIKVHLGHSRIIRIPMKHSIFTPDSEVCLIVPDVKGIQNKKHDEHLEHYQKLLDKRGVNNIKKIMTFHEFRTEYETFELRKRLVDLYDTFLVDGRISGKVVKKCGKIFHQKRKVPTSIKLQATKLKEHIEQTLKKTPLYLHFKGDSSVVQIGHSGMPLDHLIENVFYVIKGLDKEFPGGFENIRNLNLYTFRGVTFPLYTTLKNPNDVTITENNKKRKIREDAVGELTTKLNTGVRVRPTGEVSVFKLDETSVAEQESQKVKENKEIGNFKLLKTVKKGLKNKTPQNRKGKITKKKPKLPKKVTTKPKSKKTGKKQKKGKF